MPPTNETQKNFIDTHKSQPPRGGFVATTANGYISDSADLPKFTRFYRTDIDGVLSVIYEDGSTNTALPVLANVQYAGAFQRIKATGTTASIAVHCEY